MSVLAPRFNSFNHTGQVSVPSTNGEDTEAEVHVLGCNASGHQADSLTRAGLIRRLCVRRDGWFEMRCRDQAFENRPLMFLAMWTCDAMNTILEPRPALKEDRVN